MKTQGSIPITLRLAESIDEVTRKGVPHVVDFTVLHLNDVYDAAPVEGGRLGGLARVATLRRKLEKENANLLAVLVGDFLAPSAIAATTGDSGQHMIEALNAMGLTHATFGNHEFDLPEADLMLRIAESRFEWIVSNVTDGEGKRYPKVAENALVDFANADGEKVRIALLGVCLDMVQKPWIAYRDPIESAREQVAALENGADVFLVMTHLTMVDDKRLGKEVPRLDVLMGGHEHEAARAIVGDDATPIFKADANARSAFVHRFRFDTQTGTTLLFPELVAIDESFDEDVATAAVVHTWLTMTYDTLRAQGNDPLERVGRATEPLNGYEAAVRNGPTNLTRLITETFLAAVPEADALVLPSGLIRIDGIIPPGDILYFDIVRIFPTGGKLSLLNMPGNALRALLVRGQEGKGTGTFMLHANIALRGDAWWVDGEPLADDRVYKIVFSELPVSALVYFPFKGSGTTKAYDTREMRAILADRLRRDLGTEKT